MKYLFFLILILASLHSHAQYLFVDHLIKDIYAPLSFPKYGDTICFVKDNLGFIKKGNSAYSHKIKMFYQSEFNEYIRENKSAMELDICVLSVDNNEMILKIILDEISELTQISKNDYIPLLAGGRYDSRIIKLTYDPKKKTWKYRKTIKILY